MQSLILLLLVLLPGAALPAQAQLVSGRVLDAQTSQPIPYASVAVLGTSQGTTCNAEGEFALKMSALPGRLVFSQLSYRRDTVAVVAAGALPVVRLPPAPVALPDVDLGSYVGGLLQKAYRELQRTNAHKHYGQAFYRQVTRMDQRPTEIKEMMWQVKASSAGLEGTALNQARYAKKKGVLINFRNFSFFTRNFKLYSTKDDTVREGPILGPNPTQYYNLKLVGLAQDGSHQLAQIEFAPKPAHDSRHMKGLIVVDIDTYQVLRFRVSQDIQTSSNNPVLKFRDGRMTYDLVFRPAAGGAVPAYYNLSYAITMGRLLKPAVALAVSGITYFSDWQATPTAAAYAAADFKESDSDVIKQTTYDPAFWRDNPVVKRTPLEEEVIRYFESEKAFGTMLQPTQE